MIYDKRWLTHRLDVPLEGLRNTSSKAVHVPLGPILPGSYAIRDMVYAKQVH